MNNHIDISINYNGRQAAITVQILSSELPKIVYSVTPKDEELKNDFETKILKPRDLEFEFAVWNVLTQLENN
jgi:hypothetical protein